MSNIIRYLKPFTWQIILIFLLLFGQAMSDLSLPGYMSDIVNIGIQRNGIETAVPDAVRDSEYKKITLFMNSSEKAEVASSYRRLDRAELSIDEFATYVEKYPLLSASPIYVLNTSDRGTLTDLDSIFRKSISVVYAIENNVIADFSGNSFQIPEGVDPFVFFAQFTPVQLDQLNAAISSQISSLPDSALKQSATAYISNEYAVIGVEVSSIQTAYMLRIGLLMLLLTLASIACSIAVGFISARIAAGLGRNLRKKLFEKVESFSNAEFDKFSTASLITRSTNDITQIQLLMVMALRFIFYAPMMAIGGIIKVLGTDRSMLWIIAIAVGVLITLMIIIFTIAIPKFRSMQNLVDRLNLTTREILNGLMVIRAFNTQKHEESKFDKANSELTRVNLFVSRIMVLMMPVIMLIMNGVMLLIIWIGARQVEFGNMQVGDMMAVMQYAMLIIMSFLMISFMFIMIPRASISATRIHEVIQTDLTINDPEKPDNFNPADTGLVEFKDVSFRYPGAEEDVLKNISFTAKPGQTTAFIGSTGSGKSTLVNLIMRFYDVSEGAVLVNGTDVRKVRQHDLREKIGYVPQKAVLFSGTIESNIKYGFAEASGEEITKFATTAQAMDFISTSDRGFTTPVSQGGTNLSGGQKQRLSIARALARKPRIYIFDDSFSALDYRTDAALRKALKEETGNATVLIVTQRIGTILGAEQIIVLDNGMIAGKGAHKELMESSSVYREIALSQLSKEELA
jgi:ATP-binding cassette, subfamily B, multidrug efflux pump